MTSDKLRRRTAEFALFLSAAAWGSTFFLTKESLAFVDPIVLVGYRFVIAAALLLVLLAPRGRLLFQHLRHGTVLGAVLWLALVTQTMGLEYTRASNSAFITGTSILVVPILSFIVFGQRPRGTTIAAVLLSMVGLLLLTGGVQGLNRGDGLTAICAVAAGIHILLVDSYTRRGADPFILGLQQFMVVGILSLLVALLLHRPFTVEGHRTLGVIGYLALLPTLLAYAAQLVAQRYTLPMRAALILVLESPIAAILAWTVGGEAFRAAAAAGGVLMLGALILADSSVTSIQRSNEP